jgi:hypothetical protein
MLLADLAALGVAPALDGLTRARPGWHRLLTELSRVGVAGIVLLDLVPHGWASLGPLALALFVGGALGVVAVERVLRVRDDGLVGPAAVVALGAHHVVDGIGLGLGDAELSAAVVVHAVPVALVAWRIGVERGGPRLGWATVGWIALSTWVGFGVGAFGLGADAERMSTGVACALGGGLLHALLHLDAHASEGHAREGFVGGLGGLGLALGLLWVDGQPDLLAMPWVAIACLVAVVAVVVLGSRHAHRPVGSSPL